MRRSYPALVGGACALLMVAGVVNGLAHADGAASAPVSTDVPVTVIIPNLTTPTPTPTPSSSSTSKPSNSGGGGTGTGTGGSTGGGTIECAPIVDEEAPTPAAKPSDDAGKLTLDHETIAADEWMVAKGDGYTPGEMVQVAIYSGAVITDSFKADAGGNITARFRIPLDTRPGVHTAEASGWQSCFANNAEFTVVTSVVVASIPYLWWVLTVLGVLLAAITFTGIHFRHSIRRWFGGGLRPTEPAT